MAKLWTDLTQWLEEASKVVGKEAGDLTLKGRLKLEIFELKKTLRDHFTDFGMKVFDAVNVKKNKDWQKNREIVSLIKRIKGVQKKLKIKEQEYKRIGMSQKRRRK